MQRTVEKLKIKFLEKIYIKKKIWKKNCLEPDLLKFEVSL